MHSNPSLGVLVLRIKELTSKTNLCTASVYNKLNPRSIYFDEDFPKPIKLGQSAVGWLSHEVDQWLATRPRVIKPSTSIVPCDKSELVHAREVCNGR